MTDSVYAPPQADLTKVHSEDSLEAFYVVSTLKMMVMFITTMGGYQIYWHYKNWRRYQEMSLSQGGADGEIWPVARAIFSIFFIHSLFEKVKDHATALQRPVTFNGPLTATLMVCIMLAGVPSLFFKTPQALFVIMVVVMVLVVPMMFMYRNAQRFINESCGDPEGASNSVLSVANYIWMAVGICYWLYNLSNIRTIAKLI